MGPIAPIPMQTSELAIAIPAYGATQTGLEQKVCVKPKPVKRVIQLDFTRGLAILLVLGYHAITIPTSVLAFRIFEFPFKKFGWSGVDLFFVLSGFLVGGLLIGEYKTRGSIRIGRFIKRRGFKIWPAYYFYLLFQVISHHFPLSTFLVPNLLHLQNYLGTSLSHTWTLAVEEHFYLALPVLLVFLIGRRLNETQIVFILAGLCVGTLVLRTGLVFLLGSTRVWEYTHTRIDSLMFGVLLSYFYQFRRNALNRVMNQKILLGSVCILGLLFLSLVPDTSVLMHTIGYTVNYLSYGSLMLLILNSTGGWATSLAYRFIAWIGLYSYSIYLWHTSVRSPLVWLTAGMPNTLRWPVLLAAQIACGVGLGVLMAKVIEWPFLRLREKLIPSVS
ncbi:MAG: acyltransferase [Candidatus Acidiferrum sp.]